MKVQTGSPDAYYRLKGSAHVSYNPPPDGHCFMNSFGMGYFGKEYKGPLSLRQNVADAVRKGVVPYENEMSVDGKGENDSGKPLSRMEWVRHVKESKYNNDNAGVWADHFFIFATAKTFLCNILLFYCTEVNNRKYFVVQNPGEYDPCHPTIFLWHTGICMGGKNNKLTRNHFQLLGEEIGGRIVWKHDPMSPDLLLKHIVRTNTAVAVDSGWQEGSPHKGACIPVWIDFDQMHKILPGARKFFDSATV